MRLRQRVMRRLPLALLAASLGLVVAVVPASSESTVAAGVSHSAVAAGHLVEGTLVVEHPRALGQPTVASVASTASLSIARLRWVVVPTDDATRPAQVTPPAAIRGPPG